MIAPPRGRCSTAAARRSHESRAAASPTASLWASRSRASSAFHAVSVESRSQMGRESVARFGVTVTRAVLVAVPWPALSFRVKVSTATRTFSIFSIPRSSDTRLRDSRPLCVSEGTDCGPLVSGVGCSHHRRRQHVVSEQTGCLKGNGGQE